MLLVALSLGVRRARFRFLGLALGVFAALLVPAIAGLAGFGLSGLVGAVQGGALALPTAAPVVKGACVTGFFLLGVAIAWTVYAAHSLGAPDQTTWPPGRYSFGAALPSRARRNSRVAPTCSPDHSSSGFQRGSYSPRFARSGRGAQGWSPRIPHRPR